MDSLTKQRSLLRHAVMKMENSHKKMHTGNAMVARGGERLEVGKAYEAAHSGADMHSISGILNGSGSLPFDNGPRMTTEVPNSSYCIGYDELMSAVVTRVEGGGKLLPISRHAIFSNIDNVMFTQGDGDYDDAGY